MSDDLTLVVGGRKISGWNSVRVTRGIERCPSDFDVELTELYPGEVQGVVIKPGDYCQVLLGADLVITGYVDRYVPRISAGAHSIRVMGRSKCADLVDCDAEWPGGQISGSSVLEIAKKLALPYGVSTNGGASYPLTVSCGVADIGPQIPLFNLSLGEKAMDIIERICRFAALLSYDDTAGNLVLVRVGTVTAASGFTEGVNVQEASMEYSMDGLYSEVLAYIQSLDTFSDISDIGNLLATVPDPNVSRHRRKVVVAETGDSNFDVVKRRATWEVARRSGRSRRLALTTDGWRDLAGVLYTPNTLVPVDFPSLKLAPASWLISEVTYKRGGESGTTCDLVIGPPDSFLPEPTLLYQSLADVPAAAGQ